MRLSAPSSRTPRLSTDHCCGKGSLMARVIRVIATALSLYRDHCSVKVIRAIRVIMSTAKD